MTDLVDITIIGAGVIGLAIAAQVTATGKQVYVLEKSDKFGLGQSSRSSEVIHAGIYYEHDSLKKKLCTEGNSMIYELCERNDIRCLKCGKLMIATNDYEEQELEKLYRRARDNDVPVSMLSSKEMHQLEPNVNAKAAFISPTTGIIDSYELLRYFYSKAKEKGAHIVFKTEVIGIENKSNGYSVVVKDTLGYSSITTRILINCAGLHSDKIAEFAGLDIDKTKLKLHWCKGEYYSVSGKKNRLINRLIYPVPTTISVGVHVCLDVDWKLRLGPLFYFVDEINYKVDDLRKEQFIHSSITKALPFIESGDLEPEACGIMAMLEGPGDGFRDFVIRNESEAGLPGFINLVGIDSPGLTSSPAIAVYVNRIIEHIS